MSTRSTKTTRIGCLLISCLPIGALALPACNRAEPEKSDKSKLVQPTPATSEAASPGDKPAPLPVSNKDQDNSSATNPPAALASGQTPITPPANNQTAGDQTTGAGPAVESAPAVAAKPGVTIEEGTLADATTDPVDESSLEQRLGDRGFLRLQLPDSFVTTEPLLAFLGDCDRAVQELSMVRQSVKLKDEEFILLARRISDMKLRAGKRLREAKDATTAQRNLAIKIQVEALSHLSGLGDVEAAQTLQQVAGELIKSPDPALNHQGRLVMLGFRLNQLEAGVIKDPQALMEEIDQVLAFPELTLVEFLSIQQCAAVASQLGYAEAANAIQQRLVKAYRNSKDRDLSMRAWSLEVSNSPQLVAYHQACLAVHEGQETDETKVASTAGELFRAFPSANTLAYFLRMICDLEYRGRLTAAQGLAELVANQKSKVQVGPWQPDIDSVLAGHARRLELRGRPLQLEGLVGFDGQPLIWENLRGKVVLVYCWASLDLPSLNMQAQIKDLRSAITGPGFEIIGINLDEALSASDLQKVELMQGSYGRLVHSNNPNARGFNTQAAKTLGVTPPLPHFMALIDKSGTVRAIHPTFDKLPEMIAELMQ